MNTRFLPLGTRRNKAEMRSGMLQDNQEGTKMKLNELFVIFSQKKAAAASMAVLFASVVGGGFYAGSSDGQTTIRQMLRPVPAAAVQAVETEPVKVITYKADTESLNAAAGKSVLDVQNVNVPEQFRTIYNMYPSIFTKADGTLVFEVKATADTTAKETAAPQETTAAATETQKPQSAVEAKSKKKKTTAPKATTAATTAKATAATAAPAAATAAPAAGAGTFNTDMARAILDLVNQQRAAAGVPALKWNDTLAASAGIRATEIVVKWSHTRPDGSAWYTAGSQMEMGENLAYGQSSTSQVMTEWMASPGHAENILRSSFTEIGVSCYIVNGTYYWAQHFA